MLLMVNKGSARCVVNSPEVAAHASLQMHGSTFVPVTSLRYVMDERLRRKVGLIRTCYTQRC